MCIWELQQYAAMQYQYACTKCAYEYRNNMQPYSTRMQCKLFICVVQNNMQIYIVVQVCSQKFAYVYCHNCSHAVHVCSAKCSYVYCNNTQPYSTRMQCKTFMCTAKICSHIVQICSSICAYVYGNNTQPKLPVYSAKSAYVYCNNMQPCSTRMQFKMCLCVLQKYATM
jgi:hypothetical protein